MRGVATVAIGALVMLVGCVPELDDRSFLITGPTLLGIAPTPAEAAPPASVGWRVLYVDQNGVRDSASFSWDYCVAREALTDEGTVSPDCFASGGPNLVPIGAGTTATGALPADACRLFGPDPPDSVAGQPPGRPVDPDETGGYYQPIILGIHDAESSSAVGAARISCGLANATSDMDTTFASTYHVNVAPAVASLSIVHADGTSSTVPAGGASTASVGSGESVTFHATWATCTMGEAACTGAESYVLFDPESRALTTAWEGITVAWYATGGDLADDSDGTPANQPGTSSVDNAWTAPSAAGTVLLWLVIRDDRGGVAWESYAVSVE